MDKSACYVCSEYALSDELPIYAGGLGVLAADYFFQAKSAPIPYYFTGLLYHHGFVSSSNSEWKFNPLDSGLTLLKDENDEIVSVDIDIEQRPLLAQVWIKREGNATLFLFDTDLPGNNEENREITAKLYGPDEKTRILQQLVLGIGSIKLMRRLGIKPSIYHLNEGHTSFVILALIAQMKDSNPDLSDEEILTKVSEHVVATKHTILHASGLFINEQEFNQLLGQFLKRHNLDAKKIFAFGHNYTNEGTFSTNAFLLNHVSRANCVSKIHCDFEKGIHPNSSLIPITNGVFPGRWKAPNCPNPLDGTTNEELQKLHAKNKHDLLSFVAQKTQVSLNPDVLTIVWARRLTEYKRPLLIFNDLTRLHELTSNPETPIQIIISGLASFADKEGQETLRKIIALTHSADFYGKIVYLPGYSLSTAAKLVIGADLWLNTPELGKEACGTSGMKAGLNGVLEFSVPDGWFAQVNWRGVGWDLMEEGIEKNIYDVLEQEIIPTYYGKPKEGTLSWIDRMRKTIEIIQGEFTTQRMMEDYIDKLYFPKE